MKLRLVPARLPSEAANELRRIEVEASNVLGAGHRGDAVVYAYLQWVLESARMLRSMFVGADVDDLLLTRRYWHLQSAGAVDLQLAPMLVDAEIAERIDALGAARAWFESEQRRWQRGRIIVMDTSALIHGPKLWEWEPAKSLGLRDVPVHLVVPVLVIDELDGLKESSKPHTRNRARQTLKWVAEQLGHSASARIREGYVSRSDAGTVADVLGDVFLEVLADQPGHERLPIADDEIVARAVSVAAMSGREVTLVTNDFGQAYRARLAELTVSMPAEPIYDIDVQEAARAAKHTAKEAQRRAP